MKKRKIVKVIIQIIFIIILSVILVKLMRTLKDVANGENFAEKLKEEIATVQEMLKSKDNKTINATGEYEFKDEETIEDKTYETFKVDRSVILAKDEANITILNSKINKRDGNNTDVQNSKYHGINATILVKNGAIATIKNTTISSDANGANAVFATGEKVQEEEKETFFSRIYVQDSEIKTTKDSSRGLMCTYNGYIEAENMNISTKGKNSPALAINKGGGRINAQNSYFNTEGDESPIIYAMGDVNVENSSGKAKSSQMVLLEGESKVDLTNSTLECLGKGTEESKDNAGILIYQTTSGEAEIGTAVLNSKNSILKITEGADYYKEVPLFFITNTTSIINLENNLLQYGSGILLKVAGTDEWGETASNGGIVTLNAINQKLTGNIEVDDISTIKISLTQGSSLEGAINPEKTGRKVELIIDKTSKLKLTEDTYVTSFETEDKTYANIDFNGYKLYVKGTAIN